MSFEIAVVFGLLLPAAVLFVTERVSFDITALIILSVLLLTGILTVREGLSGFSNQATITIGAMFILSEGIRRTGALGEVSTFFSSLGKRHNYFAFFIIIVVIGIISAFINNTAAVAIFIPVIISVANEMDQSPSKMLIPLSFVSMFGGVCTLIGTSTNLLVSSIARDHGQPAFSMFEFGSLGVIFFMVGVAYLFVVGIRLTPARRVEHDLTASYGMSEYITDIILEPESEHVGQPLDEAGILNDLDLQVVQVFRESGDLSGEWPKTELHSGDVLRITGGAREIEKLMTREDIALKPAKEWYDVDLEKGSLTLVEAVIAPNSALEGKAIGEINFYERYGAVVLAIRHHGHLQQEHLERITLSGGDSLLLYMSTQQLTEFRQAPSFVVVSEIGLPSYRQEKMPLALAILFGVIASAALNLVPIVVSAVAGAVALIVTGCLTNDEAYQAVNWEVIFLLAGVLPLGIAMDKTGAAEMMAGEVIDVLGEFGPVAVLSGFFFLTMMLTNIISNQATAALLAPIAIQTAQALEVSSRPYLMAITYAASLSFMTPIGYQTNTLIYGAGQYKFTDFTRVGTPLNIIFWIIATLLIPVFWPL